jgi:hypothetical protein
MVKGLAPLPGGVDKDLQVILDAPLADILGKGMGAYPLLEPDLFFGD